MRRLLVAGVALVALLGGGYYYVSQRAQRELQAGLDGFRASLPSGATFTYASAVPDVVGRSAHLTDVRVVSDGEVFTAAAADVAPDGPNALRHLTLHDAAEQGPAVNATVALLEADGIAVPPGTSGLGHVDPKSMMIDHVALHDLRFTSGTTKAVVGTMTMDAYGRGRATTLDMVAVDLAAPDQSVDTATIGHVHVSGIDPASSGPGARAMDALPHGANFVFAMEGLKVVANGNPPASLAAARFESTQDGADKMVLHMVLQDLVSAPNAQAKPQFDQLGYDRLQLSMKLDGVVDRTARRLQLDQFDLDAVDMAHVHLVLALDNLPPALLAPDAAEHLTQAAAELIGLQLRAMALTYEDRSLYTRLRDLAAKSRGASPADMTAQAQAQVRRAAAQYGLPDSAVAPVLAFVADPHRLVVEMHPPQPVPVVGLPSLVRSNPDQTLGLKVTD